MSRIGKKPIALPQGVKVEVKDGMVLGGGTEGRLCPGRFWKGFRWIWPRVLSR